MPCCPWWAALRSEQRKGERRRTACVALILLRRGGRHNFAACCWGGLRSERVVALTCLREPHPLSELEPGILGSPAACRFAAVLDLGIAGRPIRCEQQAPMGGRLRPPLPCACASAAWFRDGAWRMSWWLDPS